jgi:hypothetical protein
MNHWESKIDPTHFGLIAAYLRNPNAPIDVILHVRDRALLAEVASRIERDFMTGVPPGPPLSPGLQELIRDGAVKVSSVKDLGPLDPGAVVDANQVRGSTGTHVIYLPPFYLAHTPGLFEGKVMRDAPRERRQIQEVDNTEWGSTIPSWKDRDCGREH